MTEDTPDSDPGKDVDEQLAKIGAEFGEQCALPAIVPDREDLQAVETEKTYLEKRRQLELDDFAQDIQARKEFANKLFKLIAIWLLGVFFLLMNSGAATSPLRLTIPENVLLATIGGTTASILGLLYVVVKYLFPKR